MSAVPCRGTCCVTVGKRPASHKWVMGPAVFCCVLLCVIGEFTDGSGDLVATMYQASYGVKVWAVGVTAPDNNTFSSDYSPLSKPTPPGA